MGGKRIAERGGGKGKRGGGNGERAVGRCLN